MKKQINVVGAVVVRDGTVLSAQRSQSMSLPGLWEFPGGKIEKGETPQEALAREMQEELLCDVEIGAHVETTAHEYDFGIVTLTTFYATLTNGEPQLTEHAEIRWIPAAELRTVDWAPADVPAVDRIMSDLA
ncbi:(deoxy)nucleoside triphosphate pyrophosphohydrolase [Microbacterium aerolatum]|uniref:(deoxy)nucleoside triphosphate pyrophosphohydrolase n=1 Tax=Microbacterium aerolatum TaxID=153731 RepID=UPI00384E224C